MEEKMPYRLSDVYQELMESRPARGESRPAKKAKDDTLIYFITPKAYCNHDYEMMPTVEKIKIGLTHCPSDATEDECIEACKSRYSSTYNEDWRGYDLNDDLYGYVTLGANYTGHIDDVIRELCASVMNTETTRSRKDNYSDEKLGRGSEYIESLPHKGLDEFIKSLQITIDQMSGMVQHYDSRYTRDLDMEFQPGSIEANLLRHIFYNRFGRYTDERIVEMKYVSTPTDVVSKKIIPAMNLRSIRNYDHMDLNQNGLVEICDFACKDANIIETIFNTLCDRFCKQGIDRQTIADGFWGICLTGDARIAIKSHLEYRTKCKFNHIINVPGFLNWIKGIDTEIPEKLRDMKFDYIVMNPPYTAPKTATSKLIKNLDEMFLSKAMELADTVVSIQPATWFLNDEKRVKMLEDRHCDANILSNALEMFRGEGAHVGQTLGIFKVTRGSGLTVMYDGDNKNKKLYDNIADFSQGDKHNILKTVVEKGRILGSDTIGLRHVYTNNPKTSGASHIYDNSRFIDKWTVQLTNLNKHIGKDDYDTLMFKNTGIPVHQTNNFIIKNIFAVFDTQNEAEHFYHYMMTDFVRAYVKTFRRGVHVEHPLKQIPWPDAGFLQDWDDDRIAKEIGLTDPERVELASILPDCYGIRKNIPAPVV